MWTWHDRAQQSGWYPDLFGLVVVGGIAWSVGATPGVVPTPVSGVRDGAAITNPTLHRSW